MVDILGLETALRAATTIIKIVFVFVFVFVKLISHQAPGLLAQMRIAQAATDNKILDGITQFPDLLGQSTYLHICLNCALDLLSGGAYV